MLSHTQTRTGPSSDPHWDSGDQRRVATAVSQRVRLPCHTIPKAFTKGTTLRQTNTLPPPTHTAPCPPAGTGLLGPELIHHPKILNETHNASKLNSQWLSKWNLLTGNERKCYKSSFLNIMNDKHWFGTEQNLSTARYQLSAGFFGSHFLTEWIFVQLPDNILSFFS